MRNEKYYSIADLAKLSGTNIRIIQYYDKIDLLVAKRDENNHLMYYTPSDLLTLQQILFYKKLGFSLKEIKSYLVDANNLADIKTLLKNQSDILFQKEMEIKTNIAIIETIVATFNANPNDDFETIINKALGLK